MTSREGLTPEAPHEINVSTAMAQSKLMATHNSGSEDDNSEASIEDMYGEDLYGDLSVSEEENMMQDTRREVVLLSAPVPYLYEPARQGDSGGNYSEGDAEHTEDAGPVRVGSHDW